MYSFWTVYLLSLQQEREIRITGILGVSQSHAESIAMAVADNDHGVSEYLVMSSLEDDMEVGLMN